MSLFSRLQGLISDGKTRSEDFHTEIVAHLLRRTPELTVRWLGSLELTKKEPADTVFVETQEEFEPLENHDRGSRPDISIRIERKSRSELIFIESKIGSEEGDKQLERYLDHLLARQGAEKRSLVYITRDFEPKRPHVSERVQFRQQRWYDFYRFLKDEPLPSELIRELIIFMEENNMSQSNQFSTIDILALANFQKARKIMDATLWEDVAQKFNQICGGNNSATKAFAQYREHGRYVMIANYGSGWQFEILVGYWMNSAALTDYPQIGVRIYVNPKAKSRDQIVLAMREFEKVKAGSWKGSDLANEKEWGSIYQTRGLQEFLAERDQVKIISRFFCTLLDDVADFRKRYSKLPWNAQQIESED